MKPFAYLSLMRVIGFLLILALGLNCKKDFTPANLSQSPPELILNPGTESLSLSGLSQTKTGSLLNKWGEPIANYWLQASAQHFSADDNSYAISKKLSPGRSAIPLLLQDFRFNIPANAIIENIVVAARRFETGKGSIGDNFVTLVCRIGNNNRASDGVIFRNPNFYAGIETEVIYSQKGSNDGLDGKKIYQWTPATINDPAFGVWIAILEPAGSVVVYYDLVKITVEYSLP